MRRAAGRRGRLLGRPLFILHGSRPLQTEHICKQHVLLNTSTNVALPWIRSCYGNSALSHRMTMATDEEKFKLAKLLQGLEVPDVKISERGLGLVKEFQQKFGSEIEVESMDDIPEYENPYVPDKQLLKENERKLREVLAENKRAKREEKDNVVLSCEDPKRPWRTHSSKEKLLRIDGELKRHSERGSQAVTPMSEGEMKELVEACRQETRAAPPVGMERLRDTVEEARKHLPNFQYRRIENTTATAICPDAHHSPAAPQTTQPFDED